MTTSESEPTHDTTKKHTPSETHAGSSTSSMQPGQVIWAKVKGHPWWPAKILPEDNIPQALQSGRKRPVNAVPLIFYGTKDYAWLPLSELRDYKTHRDQYAKGVTKRALLSAIKDADDPKYDLTPDAEESEEEEEEEEEEDEEEEQEEVEETPKRRKGSTSKASTAKKRKVEKRAEPEGSTGKKRGRKPRQPVEETPNGKDEESAAEKSKSIEDSSRKSSKSENKTPYDRLITLRHRLQKIFLGEQIRRDDFGKVDGFMKEVEQFDVTVQLLKETKIPKVIRRISLMDEKEDLPCNMRERSLQLLDKWRQLLNLTTAAQSAEQSTQDATKTELSTNGSDSKAVESAEAENKENEAEHTSKETDKANAADTPSAEMEA